ncbi:unnamed protein product [Caenorhabditis bovis]|uniref:Pyridoxal phosphate homeostasis protein n=1 Tax=Caenorhabditis bovis TaxID=2654633 RepID=A0A8S1EW85_9PELO|nr:unnamed protein product [Caenorhabditis bovis]
MTSEIVQKNLLSVLKTITELLTISSATVRTKRCQLVAVSKFKPAELIEACYEKGQHHFGENYVQELFEKSNLLKERCPDIRWHYIGQVQSNKIPKICESPGLYCVETVESEKHATIFDKEWRKRNQEDKLRVLVQVNTSGEENKGGISISEATKLADFIRNNCSSLMFSGFMTIGSFEHSHSDGLNPDFEALFEIRKEWAAQANLPEDSVELSMGMSDDFEQAIIQGSTSVRMDGFRNNLLATIRAVMTHERLNESSMSSWNGNATKGCEITFNGVARGVERTSGVIVQIFEARNGSFEAILNTYIIKDDLRSLIKSSTVTQNSTLSDDISNILSPLILALSESFSLHHIFMIDEIREKVLRSLDPSSAAHLAATSKSVRNSLVNSRVDNTYWKRELSKSRKFGISRKDKLSYRLTYGEEAMKKKDSRKRTDSSNLLVEQRYAPPVRQPYMPHPFGIPDPDAEFMPDRFDPLNPIPNPRMPLGGPRMPLGGPHIDPFSGGRLGGNADLDPFGDPMNREMFRPSRGGGGTGGGFSGGHFQRHDYI